MICCSLRRYIKTYFSDYPGYYFSGDGGWRDPEGHIWLTGRVDDVMNVSGHRIGTAEVRISEGARDCRSSACRVRVWGN